MRWTCGLFLICLSIPAARAETAAAVVEEAVVPEASSFDWRFSARHTALVYLTQQAAVTAGPYNSGNRLAEIPSRLLNGEWREDWRLDGSRCNAGADLRLTAERTLQTDNGVAPSHVSEAYLRTGVVACRFGDGFEARAGREVLQWGNATFRSPSNPLFIDTGKTQPIRELVGKDVLQLGWRGASGLSVSLLRNTGESGHDLSAVAPFRSLSALRVDEVDAQQSLGGIASVRDGQGLRLGGYWTRTLSDAWLVYSDATLRRGSDGLYPLADASAPGGWRFASTSDQGLRGAVLGGAAYTFESGWSLTGEALVNNDGYSDAQRRDARLAVRAGGALWGANGALASAGAAVLGDALQPRLPLLGRHYLFVQLLRTEWKNRADLAVRWARNLDDGSSATSLSLTYFLDDHSQLIWFATANRGDGDGDFSRLIRYSSQLGLRFTL